VATAVGTGINAQAQNLLRFFARELSDLTKVTFHSGKNFLRSSVSQDMRLAFDLVSLKPLRSLIWRIANECLRLDELWPIGWLGEKSHYKALQPGFVLLCPGKVNPGDSRSNAMVAAQVIAIECRITIGGQPVTLNLNAFHVADWFARIYWIALKL